MSTYPTSRCPELLAPAGSFDALVAAVNNGADAVYLGLDTLNARRGAANFDLESLAAATRFAHLRRVNVYLTANVIILPEEMSAALTMIDAAWAAGVDAVIIQDLGLLRVVHEVLPEVRVHASTQMNVMNPEGVRVLGQLGARRVTLARELPLDGIAACAAAGVEVETFVHGALCYCYSGQCLMSSLIGRRSANRGMCAQPCRLPYELIRPDGTVCETPGKYLLSTKDVAGIAHLPELIAAGVSALKVEGRMKSPEYVAIVTHVYRAALDRAYASPETFGVTPAEWDLLEEAFSRGFTDAYLTGARGKDLMSYTRPNNRGVLVGRVESADGSRLRIRTERALCVGDTLEIWTHAGRFVQPVTSLRSGGGTTPSAAAGSVVEVVADRLAHAGDRVFRVANAALIEAARRTFTGQGAAGYRAAPVRFVVRLRVGEPVHIEAVSGKASAAVSGSIVERARTKALTSAEVIEHLSRLGGSGYYLDGCEIDLDPASGLSYSVLHALRREALERLDEARLVAWHGRTAKHPALPNAVESCTLAGTSAHTGCRGARGLETASDPRRTTPRLVACVWDIAVGQACLDAGADEVLVRVFSGRGDAALPRGMHPLLPRISWPQEVPEHLLWHEDLLLASGNLGTLVASPRDAASQSAHAAEADWPLNSANPYAAAAFGALGAPRVWASPELSGRQLRSLVEASPVPVGCLVWGRVELMVAEQCVLQAAGPCGRACVTCARRKQWWRVRDRKGYEFLVTTDPTGRSHIMNAVTLDLVRALDEVVSTGVDAVRVDFSDETEARAGEVVRALRASLNRVLAGGAPPQEALVDPSTSGHFYRGVL